jgi:hypothetical protein
MAPGLNECLKCQRKKRPVKGPAGTEVERLMILDSSTAFLAHAYLYIMCE